MKRKSETKEKRTLFDWKLIRIPRPLFMGLVAFLVLLFLLGGLVFAVKYEGDRFPWLVRIVRAFGMYHQVSGKEGAEPGEVEEARFAKLIFAKGDVTVKPKQELRFQSARVGQKLQEGDSIRTYSGGQAVILFDSGDQLTIKPDSLVVIRDMKQNRLTKIRKSSIKLNQSEIEAVIRSPKVEGSRFIIVTPTALATISTAKVAIKVSKNRGSRVKVFQGNVDLKVGDKTVEMNENKSVVINPDRQITDMKDLPSPPRLKVPRNLAEFFFRSLDAMRAVLKWDSGPSGVKYRLQVALDPYFTNLVIVRTGLSDPGVVVQGLKNGIYYWRVSSMTPEGVFGDFSDYRVFKVSIDKTPPRIQLDDVLLLKVPGALNAQISGHTEIGASVTINGVAVRADRTGRFSYMLSGITPGTEISVVARDRVGNQMVLKKTIRMH